MVKKGKQTQPELFEEFVRMPRRRGRRKLRLPRGLSLTISYENLIFGAILLVMSLVVCFTLGIERGKRIGLQGSRAESLPAAGLQGTRAERQHVAVPKPQQETVQLSTRSANEEVDSVGLEVPSLAREGSSSKTVKPKLSSDPRGLTTEEISHRAEEGRYAIQLITYARKDYAEAELDKLKKRGFTPYIVRTEKYFVINIGPYESLDEAQSILKRFKSKAHYRSAFLKELPR